jgi:hypothetical protein
MTTPWLERQRYLLDFTLSSLARRKGKNLALVLLYAVVVFALASVIMSPRHSGPRRWRSWRAHPTWWSSAWRPAATT